MTTTINTTQLGETVCRALMRDLNNKSIRLEVPNRPGSLQRVWERTSAVRAADQWTVNLIPNPGFVTVSANGKYYGLGLYDDIDIGGVNRIGPEYHYVEYPENPADITGDEYVAKLRAVVEHALTKVEENLEEAER